MQRDDSDTNIKSTKYKDYATQNKLTFWRLEQQVGVAGLSSPALIIAPVVMAFLPKTVRKYRFSSWYWKYVMTAII